MNNQYNVDNNLNIKKEKKGKYILLTLLFSIIICGAIIAGLYYTGIIVFKEESQVNNTNNQVNESDKKELDIKSGIVQDLYDLVKNSNPMLDYLEPYNDGEPKDLETITKKDIPYNEKFIMAASISQTVNARCDEVKEDIEKHYSKMLGSIACDGNHYDVEKKDFETSEKSYGYTRVFKKDEIKNNLYQIFGEDYYEQKDVIEDFTFEYFYVDKLGGYIVVDTPTGGLGGFNRKLVSAKKEDKSLILTEDVDYTNGDESTKYKFKYEFVFEYNEKEESYYFSKLIKKRVD